MKTTRLEFTDRALRMMSRPYPALGTSYAEALVLYFRSLLRRLFAA